jgi:alanyl-tRNA synthetase
MHDPANEFRRIPLPRTLVNRKHSLQGKHDKHAAGDDVQQPAMRVHPVAHLRHEPLRASVEQQVEQQGGALLPERSTR